MDRLRLVIIIIIIIIIRKSTIIVIPTLALIKICPLNGPTADRMATLKLNSLKTHKGRATKLNQKVRLLV